MKENISVAVYAKHGNPADVLRVEQQPWPKPAPHEALVQMRAAPINPADLNQIEGKYPVRAELPATPGFEGAGVVVDLGSEGAADFRIGVGRYVLMPDHVHLFVCFGVGCTTTLSTWIKGLKRELDRVLLSMRREPVKLPGQKLFSFWQPGFHYRLLRNNESYAAKWGYVFQNPVRAGLVTRPEDWPYAGEIMRIDRT